MRNEEKTDMMTHIYTDKLGAGGLGKLKIYNSSGVNKNRMSGKELHENSPSYLLTLCFIFSYVDVYVCVYAHT